MTTIIREPIQYKGGWLIQISTTSEAIARDIHKKISDSYPKHLYHEGMTGLNIFDIIYDDSFDRTSIIKDIMVSHREEYTIMHHSMPDSSDKSPDETDTSNISTGDGGLVKDIPEQIEQASTSEQADRTQTEQIEQTGLFGYRRSKKSKE